MNSPDRASGRQPAPPSPPPAEGSVPDWRLRERVAELEAAIIEARDVIDGVPCDAKFSQDCHSCGVLDILNHALDTSTTRIPLPGAPHPPTPEGFPKQSDDEMGLRLILACCYAGLDLYRDDGELQDNRVQPFIDFRRDSVDEIDRKMTERCKAALRSPTPKGLDAILDLAEYAVSRLHDLRFDDPEANARYERADALVAEFRKRTTTPAAQPSEVISDAMLDAICDGIWFASGKRALVAREWVRAAMTHDRWRAATAGLVASAFPQPQGVDREAILAAMLQHLEDEAGSGDAADAVLALLKGGGKGEA